MSYYKIINGEKYDETLYELYAEDKILSSDDVRKLMLSVTDGGKLTSTEEKTLQYLNDNRNFTRGGKTDMKLYLKIITLSRN